MLWVATNVVPSTFRNYKADFVAMNVEDLFVASGEKVCA